MTTIDGLDGLLEKAHQPALSELRGLLQQVLASYGSGARLVEEQKLRRSRVYRLRFEVDGQSHSVIAKRFWPSRGLRERAALTRWMPAVGLGAHVPKLLGTATLLVHSSKPDRRSWALDLYRAAVRRQAGWELPDADRLNRVFETCEYARLANALIWPAIAAADLSPVGAFEDLAEIEQWFEKLQPVLQ
jgi:hypothetical protein